LRHRSYVDPEEILGERRSMQNQKLELVETVGRETKDSNIDV
jgi:hypothetical protein